MLRARLDHAVDLYRRGYAGYVMTTGGPGGDPSYTEGTVGRSYLVKQGVPAESVAAMRRATCSISASAPDSE